jgi:hypothetical protein
MHHFMAQLLHPTAVVDASYFPAPQIFWDRLVQLGSNQLVLTAIYGALKRKKLIGHAPKDLVSYLQEITDLNYKRNSAILRQITFLSELFNKHKIDYVFLKGAAILITKPYDTMNERMVGDIDILVSQKALLRAQQLLLNEGFSSVSNKFSFTKGIFPENSHKHLKRITHPNHIAAVEIHRRLLIKENHLIAPNNVIENKVQSKHGQWIPSKQHLWQHAILNWQYNDSGMARNALAFRSILDVLYLEPEDVMVELKMSSNASKHFYSLLSLYCGYYKTYYPKKKLVYKWKLQSKFFYKLHGFFRKLFSLVALVFNRTKLFFKSRTYRKRVLNHPKLLGQRILNFWNK